MNIKGPQVIISTLYRVSFSEDPFLLLFACDALHPGQHFQ